MNRQTLLRAIERLNLALLVSADDQCMLGRIDIQADNVHELLSEPRVVRELERLRAMGLQAISPPDAVDQRPRDAHFSRQRADAPMRRGPRPIGCRLADDLGRQRRLLRRWPAPAWGVLLDARQSRLGKAVSPLADGFHARAKFGGDVAVLLPIGSRQQDLGPQHQPGRCTPPARPFNERLPIIVRKRDYYCPSHWSILLIDHWTYKPHNNSLTYETLH